MGGERVPIRYHRFSGRRGLDAWYTLLTFFSLTETAVSHILEPLKLSNDELLVVICLAHANESIPMGEIQQSVFLTAGQARRAVDRLEARGLLARRRSRSDRRRVQVGIGKGGLDLIDALGPTMFDLVAGVAKVLGEDGTEFIRAKVRKVLSSAAAPQDGRCYSVKPPPDVAPDDLSEFHAKQRPATWGLAGWLRWCQLSGRVDKLWKTGSVSLGLTQRQLQVLVVLADAAEDLSVEVIASVTGMPEAVVISNLSRLERIGLASCGASSAKRTAKGADVVLEAMSMANSLAEDLYHALNDEDLERVLDLMNRACGAARQAQRDYGAEPSPATSALV